MIFKHLPEDFSVEEIPIELPPGDTYTLYKLTKTNIGTMEALRVIMEEHNLSWQQVSWAGLKDKVAKTIQYVTLEKDIGPEVFTHNVLLQRIGPVGRKLTPGDLQQNWFTIVLRDLTAKQVERLQQQIPKVETVPNYYDSQRFGSARHGQGFFAKELMHKNYEQALRLYMATPDPREHNSLTQIKTFVRDNWGKWDTCLRSIPEKQWKIRKIVEFLQKNPEDYFGAIRKIEKKLRTLMLFAYQSYLFNEILRTYLQQKTDCVPVPYEVGEFAFPREPYTHELHIPLLTKKAQFPPEFTPIVEKILQKEGFPSIGHFKLPNKMREIFLKANERAILVKPEGIKILSTGEDECFTGKKKLTLQFTLPKGSYATIVLKSLKSQLEQG